MQRIHISGRYEVANVNNRKETHGEEKILAVDVKMTGFASVRELVPMLGVDSETDALGTLWDAETGDLTLLNIATLKPADAKFEGLCGTIGGVSFSEAVAHKFSLEPGAGGGQLTVTVSIPHPDKPKVGTLAEMIGETHKLELGPMQSDIEDESEAP